MVETFDKKNRALREPALPKVEVHWQPGERTREWDSLWRRILAEVGLSLHQQGDPNCSDADHERDGFP